MFSCALRIAYEREILMDNFYLTGLNSNLARSVGLSHKTITHSMNDAVDDFISTRWSLVRALKNKGDDESWRHFFDIYWKLIYCVAKKAGFLEVEAQEVVQETVICVARQIEDFRADPGAGSFKGWLLTITRRRVVDQFRRRSEGRYVPA